MGNVQNLESSRVGTPGKFSNRRQNNPHLNYTIAIRIGAGGRL
jgi:hypothetical protein